jgi:SAM-dependent methyltransferase
VAPAQQLHVPEQFRRGQLSGDEEASVASARWLIEYMCERLGLADLGSSDVLDYGCGVKFTQAILRYGLPLQHYVGVDIYGEMIDFLAHNVDDPRFEYFHVNSQNDLYNPEGEPFSADMAMPIDGRDFDVICLFSVFTHLAPDDYVAMLRLLRRFVRPDGRCFFTVYFDEVTPGGYGLIDSIVAGMQRTVQVRPDSPVAQRLAAAAEDAPPAPRFRDLDPANPLKWALYSRDYAIELVEGTGWAIEAVCLPDVHIQHHMVLRPV